MPKHQYFVTGTDTEVGKTSISCALLYLARKHGLSTAAGKPVASGSEQTPQGLRNRDACLLQAQCVPPIPYYAINPVAFEPAIAPHIAAREAHQKLSVDRLHPLMLELLEREADFSLIEGAGGWRVPLNNDETLADLAKALGLPVIMVVGVKLGAINHACLTFEAIRSDGLEVAGWVANLSDALTASHAEKCRLVDNLLTLKQWLPAPSLGVVPHLEDPSAENIAAYLDMSILLG